MLRTVKTLCSLSFGIIKRERLTSLFGQSRKTSQRHSRHFTFSYIGKVFVVSDSKLREQSISFSVSVIKLVKELKSKKESIISNQIGRSGTSIGANIHEAQYAHSKADFVAKLQIALKEANETAYWLGLLYKTDYIDDDTYKKLHSECSSIRVMLISSIKTAKENLNKT